MPDVIVRIPDELAERLAALPAAASDFNAFAVALFEGAARLAETDLHVEDPEAVAEIGAAIAEMEEAEVRGDYGRPIEQFWAEMDTKMGRLSSRVTEPRP